MKSYSKGIVFPKCFRKRTLIFALYPRCPCCVCCSLSDSGPTKHEAAAAVLRFFFTPYNRAAALTQIFNCFLNRVEEGGKFPQRGQQTVEDLGPAKTPAVIPRS